MLPRKRHRLHRHGLHRGQNPPCRAQRKGTYGLGAGEGCFLSCHNSHGEGAPGRTCPPGFKPGQPDADGQGRTDSGFGRCQGSFHRQRCFLCPGGQKRLLPFRAVHPVRRLRSLVGCIRHGCYHLLHPHRCSAPQRHRPHGGGHPGLDAPYQAGRSHKCDSCPAKGHAHHRQGKNPDHGGAAEGAARQWGTPGREESPGQAGRRFQSAGRAAKGTQLEKARPESAVEEGQTAHSDCRHSRRVRAGRRHRPAGKLHPQAGRGHLHGALAGGYYGEPEVRHSGPAEYLRQRHPHRSHPEGRHRDGPGQ